jgi:hypothetical protein
MGWRSSLNLTNSFVVSNSFVVFSSLRTKFNSKSLRMTITMMNVYGPYDGKLTC